MCEKAEKLQSSKREYGDCIVLKGEEYLVGLSVYWLENYGNGKPCKQWVTNYWESDYPVFYGSKCIFLPTQVQLQRMLGYTIMFELLEHFRIWYLAINGTGYYDSMEQLWLAFVMRQVYGRVWDEDKEEWVGSPESKGEIDE